MNMLSRPTLLADARALSQIVEMHCDGPSLVLVGCPAAVAWALWLRVPSRTQAAPDHRGVTMDLKLHCCHAHKDAGCFTLDRILTGRLKAQVEAYAKKVRPIDWKPDFEACFIEYRDIYSPAYKQRLAAIEGQCREAAEQILGAPIARSVD